MPGGVENLNVGVGTVRAPEPGNDIPVFANVHFRPQVRDAFKPHRVGIIRRSRPTVDRDRTRADVKAEQKVVHA